MDKWHQALSAAFVKRGVHHVAVEIGPHTAFKGPSQQTIADHISNPILCVGTWDRWKNDVYAISDSLAQIWEQFGTSAVDLSTFEAAFSNGTPTRLIKGLPPYA
nr:hybrid pks-nrps synthetase [Quercus suber]